MNKYLLVIIAFFLGSNLFAQNKKLIILDSLTEQSLAGATAILLNSNKSFRADNKGVIDLPLLLQKNDTIKVSFIGYITKRFPISRLVASDNSIKLKPINKNLQDVSVSTGYQKIPKERATGSFYKITNKELNQRVSPNIMDRMENIAPGVLYDKRYASEPYKIQIRGLSTLTESIAQPLIIVNNFPYTGDINDINPDDVQDITILRDAAAASIWGAKAGNGVIVITLKTPTENNKPKISFNSTLTTRAKPDLFKANQMSPSDYIDVEEMLFDNGYYSWKFGSSAQYPVTPVVDILYQKQQGLITPAQATKSIDSLRQFDIRNDLLRYLYRSETLQQYNLSVTGGSKTFQYLLSAGYQSDLQNLMGNKNKRLTLHWNNNINITSRLSINTDAIFTQRNTTNNSPGSYTNYASALSSTLYPYATLMNPDGTPTELDINYNKYFTDTAGAGQLLDWKLRPLDELKNTDNTILNRSLLATLGVNFKILPGLDLDLKGQYGYATGENRNYMNVNSYFARDLINKFTNLNANEVQVRNPVPIGGILKNQNSDQKSYDIRGQLNYNKSWGNQGNHLSAIAGAEIQQTKSGQSYYTTYGYDDKTLTFTSVDFANEYPIYGELLGNQYIPNSADFREYLNRFVSFYGNASYTYHYKYTLSGSIRKDESNLFGVDANQKGVPLWSLGGSWQLSKEDFYNISWLPYLKFRLTYGKSGNVNNSVSALATIRYMSADRSKINIPSAIISNYPNPNLKWEKVKMVNMGVDFATRNNVLSGSFEYYNKKSIDLLSDVATNPTVGVLNMTLNAGSMVGSGVDVVLNSKNITGSFNWKTNLLFSVVQYKVLNAEYFVSLTNFTSSGKVLYTVPGWNPYVIVSYRWGGLDAEGNPQGYANGKLTSDYSAIKSDTINDQVVSGSALPTVFGSLRNTFAYKCFTLAFNLSYKMGYYFRKQALNYYYLFANGNSNKDYVNRWKKPGDEKITNIPSMIYPANSARGYFYENSSITALPADNVKLTDIYLGYQLSFKRIDKLFKNMEIYASINGLNWMIWKKNSEKIDPDFPTGYKPPATVSFGLKFNL